MVSFNQCKIDKEGKNLILNISIENMSYYSDMTIKSITINTDKTFKESGPVGSPIKEYDNKPKSVQLVISATGLGLENLNNNIFFVYVTVEGTPGINTPCGKDNKTCVDVAVNLKPIYTQAMSNIKELGSECVIPKNFIDFILKTKALELAIKTGNYSMAIKLWSWFLSGNKVSLPSNTCNCHGYN